MEKMLIQWSGALGAGILWMDYQHQGLIEKINDLYTAILEKKGESLIAELTGFLDEYVSSHFALEEAYMMEFGYPEKQGHCAAHDQFRKNLREFKALKNTAGSIAAESLCYDLYEWFKTHISTADKTLGLFLRAKKAI